MNHSLTIEPVNIQTPTTCYHCGNECDAHSPYKIEEKNFCCRGCKTVYEILSQNQLCDLYRADDIDKSKLRFNYSREKFQFLDNSEIVNDLVDFKSDTLVKAHFHLPSVHCNSCVWLLEKLPHLNAGILEARLNFLKKEIYVAFHPEKISYRQVVELLAQLGYEPLLNLNHTQENKPAAVENTLIIRLAVAGFCAGNIMMFSFPEYFGLDAFSKQLGSRLVYLNFLLSLPVVFYSGWVYFDSVFRSLRKGFLNIDFPILLGILATFIRSVYEVIAHTGTGYFDSLSGLIFLLLTGKYLQHKTHHFISFNRDYKSYFPLHSCRITKGEEEYVALSQLDKGNKIRIRHQEIIPADGILYHGTAWIDYSFVTGESAPQLVSKGELIYAGGKQLGQTIELEIVKKPSQSYLVSLWNHSAFKKDNSANRYVLFSDLVGKYFTVGLLILTALVCLYWAWADAAKIPNVFTAMLTVACPCTLALTYPVALGNVLRIWGKIGFFAKDITVAERISKVDTWVFDKTGTLTDVNHPKVTYNGTQLTPTEYGYLYHLFSQSVHPLSTAIASHLKYFQHETVPIDTYDEHPGLGLEAKINKVKILAGSAQWLHKYVQNKAMNVGENSTVHVVINDHYKGFFSIQYPLRNFLPLLINNKLTTPDNLYILSGDKPHDHYRIVGFIGKNTVGLYEQSPHHKLEFITNLSSQNRKPIMFGDGLNDAGALQAAYVGVAVTNSAAHFAPAADVIASPEVLNSLNEIHRSAITAMRVVKVSFWISVIYNILGLGFAVSGQLQPMIAAILMPLNSLTVVGIAFLGTQLYIEPIFKKHPYESLNN